MKEVVSEGGLVAWKGDEGLGEVYGVGVRGNVGSGGYREGVEQRLCSEKEEFADQLLYRVLLITFAII